MNFKYFFILLSFYIIFTDLTKECTYCELILELEQILRFYVDSLYDYI
jgi:hypothetical protein